MMLICHLIEKYDTSIYTHSDIDKFSYLTCPAKSHINSFSAKLFIIVTTGRTPSLLGVATTKVRFLGI